uniref:Uncharacterized protein n=2 Tax=Anguilla anguilla TaxID=7936 RepID=A0A0E9U6L8_ANGAN
MGVSTASAIFWCVLALGCFILSTKLANKSHKTSFPGPESTTKLNANHRSLQAQ